ncbi:MAG: hypothetical protein ACLT74_04705 [Christensenellales bacterium]
MYWGSISQKMADAFVSQHLLNPQERDAAPAECCGERPAVPQCAGEQLERAVEGLTYQRDYRLGALRV